MREKIGTASATRGRRTRIEDLRRQELIDAAHRVFLRHGLSGLTTTRICKEAGMSQGILTYYFSGKDEVLFAMVRKNNRVLVEQVVENMRTARTRWDRLNGIIAGNFPAGHFVQEVALAWLSICAASGQEPRFARLQQLFYARLTSNVVSAVVPVLDRDTAVQLSYTIGAQIDGLWLRRATDAAMTRDRAVELCQWTVTTIIGAETLAALKADCIGTPGG
ncbi:transcriptional regulator BetI [Pseudodonghicola flavimaris]|uniref:Transcriptional regulator BetI n=1 Tax=Pseudodonghicola flavimaris TaxID=3050036 RepID=A0ABT7F8B0_9RHOB|nr:transcriptional regulator BetI [Pseudodonghicola flavimaris]MDK3020837.1 transcriptional regulator BetI [Pseudodonghicola flavimaris]